MTFGNKWKIPLEGQMQPGVLGSLKGTTRCDKIDRAGLRSVKHVFTYLLDLIMS